MAKPKKKSGTRARAADKRAVKDLPARKGSDVRGGGLLSSISNTVKSVVKHL